MQIQVKADDAAMEVQLRQLLDFYLTGLSSGLQRVDIALRADQGAPGQTLYRCRLHALPWRGPPLEVEDLQADMVLSVTRVLDRSARTLRRRQQQRHRLALTRPA